MKVSVVIPVYNAEKFLKRCLNSVLAQSIREKEIICVDDGSTDRSLEILEEYEKKYKNIYILKQKNQYAGVARNYGLSIAQGEYIHFMDADDYILYDVYSDIYELAIKEKADYLKTRNIAFDMSSGEKLKSQIYYSLEDWDIGYFNRVLSIKESPEILLRTCVAPWSGWVKRSYIVKNKIEFNNLKCVNDRSFYAEVISNTDRIVISDKYMVGYQVNNRKSLVGIRDKNFKCHIKSCEIIRDKIKNIPEIIKKKVLTEELRNLVWIYEGLSEEQKSENIDILKKYLKNFDWTEINSEVFLDPVMNCISQELQICLWHIYGMQLRINSLPELKNCLCESQNIVIYGAGRVSEALMKFMTTSDKQSISCIVVSSLRTNTDNICGIPIREKSKEIFDKAQTIIIATLENAHLSIYCTLLDMGKYNIKAISESAYRELVSFNEKKDFDSF